jgi:hypothetical protein
MCGVRYQNSEVGYDDIMPQPMCRYSHCKLVAIIHLSLELRWRQWEYRYIGSSAMYFFLTFISPKGGRTYIYHLRKHK